MAQALAARMTLECPVLAVFNYDNLCVGVRF